MNIRQKLAVAALSLASVAVTSSAYAQAICTNGYYNYPCPGPVVVAPPVYAQPPVVYVAPRPVYVPPPVVVAPVTVVQPSVVYY